MRVRRAVSVRRWPLWELPARLICLILVTVTVWAAALAAAGVTETVTVSDGLAVAAVVACLAATIELTCREGDSSGVTFTVYAIWLLPAILLPPVCALAVPAAQFVFVQWRVRRVPAHRRVFSTAATGLSYGAACLVFHLVTSATGAPAAAPLPWAAAIVAAAAAQWVASTALIGAAATLASPGDRFRDLVLSTQTLRSEAAEMSLAALVTTAATITPFAIVLAFPLVTVFQRAVRHDQLASTARLDAKTGLLNAGAWEKEAVTEIARAVRNDGSLAVAMIDLDHFKAVNDTYGHLAGDTVLKAVAAALKDIVRTYDLAGRWGGEEFVVLLPGTGPVDAYAIAERIRADIAALRIVTGTQPVPVTVSVGVAALGTTWDTEAGSQLADFMAAADMALYHAKAGGRDMVCVITENATYGTHLQRAFTPPQQPRLQEQA